MGRGHKLDQMLKAAASSSTLRETRATTVKRKRSAEPSAQTGV